tara:strand:+ start:536 stop:838 length:303 start_codon:yes stop_codon:yes gene_type:complete
MSLKRRENLKKVDISREIYSNFGISSLYANNIINSTINIMIHILRKEGILKIKNLGTFKVLNKNERVGRNPKNKEHYVISSRKTVIFKTSEFLKKKINKI